MYFPLSSECVIFTYCVTVDKGVGALYRYVPAQRYRYAVQLRTGHKSVGALYRYVPAQKSADFIYHTHEQTIYVVSRMCTIGQVL
jgi:hypothetical protein